MSTKQHSALAQPQLDGSWCRDCLAAYRRGRMWPLTPEDLDAPLYYNLDDASDVSDDEDDDGEASWDLLQ